MWGYTNHLCSKKKFPKKCMLELTIRNAQSNSKSLILGITILQLKRYVMGNIHIFKALLEAGFFSL